MMGRWEGRGGPREARKAERVARGWREREKGQRGRGGKGEEKQQQLEKPESGKKWGVVNRALTVSPTAPPRQFPLPSLLSLHLISSHLAWHHDRDILRQGGHARGNRKTSDR